MNTPALSILIPTIVGREKQFEQLFAKLYRLCNNEFTARGTIIQIAWEKDNKEISIGAKRNKLHAKATGGYLWTIDDDDDVDDWCIGFIIDAIKQNPDCVSFQERVTIDGIRYKSNHSKTYDDWEGDGTFEFSDGFHYHRTPFFKSAIKADIAKAILVEDSRYGEDHQWAKDISPFLETEIHIEKELYLYNHTSSNFNERYGFNQ